MLGRVQTLGPTALADVPDVEEMVLSVLVKWTVPVLPVTVLP
jgi:hypothetical protein